MTKPKESTRTHHHHQLVQNDTNYHHHHYKNRSPSSAAVVLIFILIFFFVIVTAQQTRQQRQQQQQQQSIPPISQILQDISTEDVCSEFHKDCHCGSIAVAPGASLFTRLVYPNSSAVIEEYDDNVPYGYKLYRVYYKCADEENVLVGNNMRECADGNWRGQVPRCVLNLRNATKLKNIKFSDYRYQKGPNISAPETSNEGRSNLNVSETTEAPINAVKMEFEHVSLNVNGVFEIPLADQPEKCISWSLFPEQVWSMTLSVPARIHYVRIKLYGDKIEDLHQNKDILFSMTLKNITYVDAPGEARGREDVPEQPKPVDMPNVQIRCKETFPKTSQYVNSYKQKYSANYLILDFLCEAEGIQKSIFEYIFSYDYAIDQLYASVIEIRFSMLNLKVAAKTGSDQSSHNSHHEIELAQKIFVTRMCALKVYAFHTDCGTPDIPVNAIVQREYNFLDDNERKTYKYICNDKNQELKGNSFVECGYYSRWKNEFPQCVRFRPCELLQVRKTSNDDYVLDVTYESPPVNNKSASANRQVVPNGKWARFRCIKRSSLESGSSKSMATVTPPANVKASHKVMYQGGPLTQVICRNGQWIGLDSAGSKANCIQFPSSWNTESSNFKMTSSGDLNSQSGNLNVSSEDDPKASLVSLPLRLIRILFALFIILCLVIVSLLVYMFIFRHQMNSSYHAHHHGSGKSALGHYNYDNYGEGGHLLNSQLIPTIMYNGSALGSDNNVSGNETIYCTEESNVYERISLEHENEEGNSGLHLYQTIKIGGTFGSLGGLGGGKDGSNYSEMGTYPSSLVNEERENSIYGMEEEIDLTASSGDLVGTPTSPSSLSYAVASQGQGLSVQQNNSKQSNPYNQLDRSSSMFMKSNSIYENRGAVD